MNTNNVGVIVGRFQVPEPTAAHIELFEYAISTYSTVIIIIGYSPIFNRNNIIPNGTIKNIINNKCEKIIKETGHNTKIIISIIQDIFNPPLWSLFLDKQILQLCQQNSINSNNIFGIGGRDSFLDSYSGNIIKHDRFHSKLGDEISASEIRTQIYKKGVQDDPKFLEGMIYERLKAYPTAYQTVDALIMFDGAVLLGRRRNNPKYRLIGGFSDPDSISLEEDAIRECLEETRLVVTNPKYITSVKIDDARYKNTGDCIKTALFTVEASEYGNANFDEPMEENGADDMPFIRWFMPEDIDENMIVKEHVKLYNILKTNNLL